MTPFATYVRGFASRFILVTKTNKSAKYVVFIFHVRCYIALGGGRQTKSVQALLKQLKLKVTLAHLFH